MSDSFESFKIHVKVKCVSRNFWLSKLLGTVKKDSFLSSIKE